MTSAPSVEERQEREITHYRGAAAQGPETIPMLIPAEP
jgi:hypothetical protein